MCLVAALAVPANLVNSNVVRAVRRRGNLNNGANYGPRYVSASNAPSHSNWNYGGALYPYPVKRNTLLYHVNENLNATPIHIAFPWFHKESKYHPTGIGLVGKFSNSRKG